MLERALSYFQFNPNMKVPVRMPDLFTEGLIDLSSEAVSPPDEP